MFYLYIYILKKEWDKIIEEKKMEEKEDENVEKREEEREA